MLVDLQTGAKREVDVCIFSEIAGHTVTISIECRDHKRVQDVTWVEQEISKHARLQTNVLVLVSSSGFTAEAYAVAERSKVKLVSPGEVPQDFAAQVEKLIETLWVKTISVTVTRVLASLDALDAWPEDTVSVDPSHVFFDWEGQEGPSVTTVADQLVHQALQAELGTLMRDATGAEKYLTLVAELPTPNDQMGLYLKRTDVDPPILRRVNKIEVHGTPHIEVVPMPMTRRQLDGTPYAYGAAQTSAFEFLAVTTNLEQDQPGPEGTFVSRGRPRASQKASHSNPSEDGADKGPLGV